MYPNMTKYLPFYLDTEGYYQNDKSFMIIGNNISYLTAFLNSSLFKFCYIEDFPELQGGTRELRKIFLDKIPVLLISDTINNLFEKMINTVQLKSSQNQNTKDIEVEIDNLLFDLYNLTSQEKEAIGFIEIQ